jgi:4-hydroxy-tetrahydrodipicolinate reductase
MRILLLGRGKTGSLVADVAQERGHSLRSLSERENVSGSALTPPFLAMFDIVIDFTTPEAVLPNMRACLAAGARMVVGTTGWYDSLPDIRGIVERRGGALLYSSNFSAGVQIFFQLAQQFGHAFAHLPDYQLHITETHHSAKLDAPSGTAKTVRNILANVGVEAEITSHRTGDAIGDHAIQARSADDRILLQHEAFSRRSFAMGAVRGAEWLAGKTGVYDYRDVFAEIYK